MCIYIYIYIVVRVSLSLSQVLEWAEDNTPWVGLDVEGTSLACQGSILAFGCLDSAQSAGTHKAAVLLLQLCRYHNLGGDAQKLTVQDYRTQPVLCTVRPHTFRPIRAEISDT